MALEIKTEIIIKATPEEVWDILTDFEAYPNWNPFILSIKGDMQVERKIKVEIKPDEMKSTVFTPKIVTVEAHQKLSWLGHLGFPGLFDGKHTFELLDNSNRTTTFIHKERFRGILVPFFKKKLNTNTKNGFIKMNQKLKELAEQNTIIRI